MFTGNEKIKSYTNLYICTKLTIISSSRDAYCDPSYFMSAAAGLNTGEEKYIFTNEAAAKELLNKKGTTWCVYQVIKSQGKQIAYKEDHIFRAEDIVAMYFHPLFPHEDIIKESPGALQGFRI